jgi:hypothetical protein
LAQRRSSALAPPRIRAAARRQADRDGAIQEATESVGGGHEQAHVDARKRVLGSKAVAEPKIDFKGTSGRRARS